jgi:hypothetical protein
MDFAVPNGPSNLPREPRTGRIAITPVGNRLCVLRARCAKFVKAYSGWTPKKEFVGASDFMYEFGIRIFDFRRRQRLI